MNFNIERWDSVILPTNVFPFPVVYIKPTNEFKKYVDVVKQVIICSLSPNTFYNDKEYIGVVYSADKFPSYRPQFYNDTNYYVIVLLTFWKGYPNTQNNPEQNVILHIIEKENIDGNLGALSPEIQFNVVEFKEESKEADLSSEAGNNLSLNKASPKYKLDDGTMIFGERISYLELALIIGGILALILFLILV